jgi:hypothetical protein
VSSSEIDLSWQDNATDETGFTVERSPDGSTWTIVTSSLPADATSYADTGLSPGTTYLYRVKASNANGSSAYSNTASATAMLTYRQAVLADGAVGYWRLAEASGAAVDEAGHAAGGAYTGGVTRGVPGALVTDPNLAARFDGTSGYVSVPDNGFLHVGDVFSYELWVKRGATLGVTQRLLHKGGGTASLGFGTNNKVVLIPGGAGTAALATSTIAITDQNWHHIVATKDGATTRLYIDGVDRTAAGTNTTMTSNTTALNIGRATTNSAYFDGTLDEVAIYPSALTSQQILTHYQAGTT